MSVYNLNGETTTEQIKDDDDGNLAEEEEELDPRIQNELERLNKSCADINSLENELDETKTRFIFSKKKQLERLQYWQKKNNGQINNSIMKCKPYYEAVKLCEAMQQETQNAVHEFQKANSLYRTAKETLDVAEVSLREEFHGEIPGEWQEHLSLTITKIGLSREGADRAEKQHQAVAEQCRQAEKRAQFLEKDLKKHIEKSKLYYDEKLQWNVQIETQKSHIHHIEQTLIYNKKVYKEAMQNLSQISEEIHNKRKLDKILKAEACSLKTSSTSPDSISIESQTTSEDTDSKKVSNFLNLYNLSLPQNNTESSSSTTTTKTYDQLKDCEASEYISLGVNNYSTPSNSRSSSPSNSICDTDICVNNSDDWINKSDGNQTKKEIINSTTTTESSEISCSNFSNSSVSRQPSYNNKEQQFIANNNNNLGICSLTLKSPEKKTITIAENKKSSNRIISNKPKNETPLLSNLLLQHSARF